MKHKPTHMIVVGASSGLGQCVAEAFADMGVQVAIAARSADKLRDIASRHPGMVYRTLDVTDSHAVDDLHALIEANGGMDTLFISAGCGWNDPTLNPEREARTVDVNAVGFTRIAEAGFHWFRDNGIRGHLCAITSIAGVKGMGTSATYSATKRYQWTLLQALDQLSAMQGLGIRITDIRPGFVDTPLLNTATSRYPMTMTVGHAGRAIVRAVLRGRRVAVIDGRWAVVTALWRRIPNWLWRRLKIVKG